MKGGVFNRPECCNNPCECPVCLENKLLMRLNCNHYVCLDDIQLIINNNNPILRRCPICRVQITNYGCNGNIVNVANYDNEGETDEEDFESDEDEYDGGKNKRKYTRRKNNKKRKTHRKNNKKRKTYRKKINKRKTYRKK